MIRGSKMSLESRLKMSISRKGIGKGKKLAEYHKYKISMAHLGLKHSEETKNKISIGNFKGENVTKKAIHLWLQLKYGKAYMCENDQNHIAKQYDWANLNNHIYRRKREDFKMLCHSCHSCHLKLDYSKGRNKKGLMNQ